MIRDKAQLRARRRKIYTQLQWRDRFMEIDKDGSSFSNREDEFVKFLEEHPELFKTATTTDKSVQ